MPLPPVYDPFGTTNRSPRVAAPIPQPATIHDPFGQPEPARITQPQLTRISPQQRYEQAQKEGPDALLKFRKKLIEETGMAINQKLAKGESYQFKTLREADMYFDAMESVDKDWLTTDNISAFWGGLKMVGQSVVLDPFISGSVSEAGQTATAITLEMRDKENKTAKVNKRFSKIISGPDRVPMRIPAAFLEGTPRSSRSEMSAANVTNQDFGVSEHWLSDLYVQQEREIMQNVATFAMQATAKDALKKVPNWLQTDRSEALIAGAGGADSFAKSLSAKAVIGANKLIGESYVKKARALLSPEQQKQFDQLNPKSMRDIFDKPTYKTSDQSFLQKVYDVGSAAVKAKLKGELPSALPTAAEAANRAGMDMQIIFAMAGGSEEDTFRSAAEGKLNRYLEEQAESYWQNQKRTGAPKVGKYGHDLRAKSAGNLIVDIFEGIPSEEIEKWRGSEKAKAYIGEAKDFRAAKWYLLNQLQADRMRALSGREPLISQNLRAAGYNDAADKMDKMIKTDAAEGLSYVIDLPAMVAGGAVAASRGWTMAGVRGAAAPVARGVLKKTGATVAEEVVEAGVAKAPLAARAVQQTGEWAKELGKYVEKVPERMRGATARGAALAAGDEAIAETVEATIKNTQIRLLNPFAWASEITEVTGKVIRLGGEATEAIGREMARKPGAAGPLARIAGTAENELWVRSTASALRRADPALQIGASFVRGGAAGSATGFGLGALSGDPEVAFAGGGAGLGMGIGMTVPTSLMTPTVKLRQKNDIDTWLNRIKNQEELLRNRGLDKEADHIRDVHQVLRSQDFETQVRAAEMEDLVGGVSEMYGMPEVPIKWFYDESSIGRGYYADGEIHINLAGRDISESLPHEVMHALEQVPHEGMQEALGKINTSLFGIPEPGGKRVGGMYTPDDQVAFANQYLKKLSEKMDATARKLDADPDNTKLKEEFWAQEMSWAEWMRRHDLDPSVREVDAATLFSNEKFLDTLHAEVRAELHSSYYRGEDAGSTYRTTSVKQKFIDMMLLQDSSSKLGRARMFLERRGIKFGKDGAPSEIFLQPGTEGKHAKGLTSSPQVNVAMRDYVKLRKSILERMPPDAAVADVGIVVSAKDLSSAENLPLVKLGLGDGNFAKDRNGNLLLVDGKPVPLDHTTMKRNEQAMVDGVMGALDKVESGGGVQKVDTADGKARWEGSNFNKEQLDALLALPDEVLPPSIKEKLKYVHERMLAGETINMNYNGALKGEGRGKRYRSTISAKWTHDWFYAVEITKAGNINYRRLNIDHIMRKMRRWESEKHKGTFLDLWDGNVGEFRASIAQYLDNHQKGLPGETNLHSNTATADKMKQRLNEVVDVYRSEEARTITVSPKTKRQKGPERGARVDRINWMKDGSTEWRMDVGKLRKNQMPAGNKPTAPKGDEGARYMPAGKGDFKVHKTVTGSDGWLFRDGTFLNLGDNYSHEGGIIQWAKEQAGTAGIRTRNANARKILLAAKEGGARSRGFDFAARVVREKFAQFDKLWVEAGSLTSAQRRAAKDWGIENGVEVTHSAGSRNTTLHEPEGRGSSRYMPAGEPVLGGKEGSLVPKEDRVTTGAPPRIKALEESARRVDKMSRDELAKEIEELSPIRPVADDRIPNKAELNLMDDLSKGFLNKTQQENFRKPVHGDEIEKAAIDITAFERSSQAGTPVHPVAFNDSKGKGYSGYLLLDNAKFTYGSSERALKIAQGAQKSRLAFVDGTANTRNIPTREELMRTNAKGERVWTQAGFNPTKHGYFFDKHNPNMKVLAGDRMLMSGNTVWVRNAKTVEAVKTPGLKRMGEGGAEVRYMPAAGGAKVARVTGKDTVVLDKDFPAQFMPSPVAPNAVLKDFHKKRVQILTTDLSVAGDKAVDGVVIKFGGGPGHLGWHDGWGYTGKANADAFGTRWRNAGEPLIGLTSLTPNNHLNQPLAREYYTAKWREVIENGLISERQVNEHVREVMDRLVKSKAKGPGALPDKIKEQLAKVKTFKQFSEIFHDPKVIPWTHAAKVYKKLDAKTLPILQAEQVKLGTDLDSVAHATRQPEYHEAPVGSLLAIAEYDGTAPTFRPDLNVAYPWFVPLKEKAFLKGIHDVRKLSTDKDLLTPKGKVNTGTMMGKGIMLDKLARGDVQYMPAGSDASYMKAAKKGDTKGAQLLVDQAAKAAGYTIGPVYHGTPHGGFTAFDKSRAGSFGDPGIHGKGFYFASSKHLAAVYKDVRPGFNSKADFEKWKPIPEDQLNRQMYPAYLKAEHLYDANQNTLGLNLTGGDVVQRSLIAEGFDGAKWRHRTKSDPPSYEYVVFDPNQIKSADPITKDADGNIIPLSERFNPKSDDIRYMPAGEKSYAKAGQPPKDALEAMAWDFLGMDSNPGNLTPAQIKGAWAGYLENSSEAWDSYPVFAKYWSDKGLTRESVAKKGFPQILKIADIKLNEPDPHARKPSSDKQLRLERDLKKLKGN